MSDTTVVVVEAEPETEPETTETLPPVIVVEAPEIVLPAVTAPAVVEIVAADLLAHAHARIAELEAAEPVVVEIMVEPESEPEPDETPDRKHWAHRSLSELTGKA